MNGKRPADGSASAACRLETVGDSHVLRIAGDWRMPHFVALDGALAALPKVAFRCSKQLQLDGVLAPRAVTPGSLPTITRDLAP